MTDPEHHLTGWQHWLKHPESVWLRKALFHAHLWIGTAASLYIVFLSLSGSVIVYRNVVERTKPNAAMERLVSLHENLLSRGPGGFADGIGAICLTFLALTGAIIWWPGIEHWRRAMKIRWNSHFPRFTWDVHSALGFWYFPLLLTWGLSGIYFAFPQWFYAPLALIDPADKFTDRILGALSLLHFGRFGWVLELFWSLSGLVLALLAVSGVFLSCRRMIYKIPPARP